MAYEEYNRRYQRSIYHKSYYHKEAIRHRQMVFDALKKFPVGKYLTRKMVSREVEKDGHRIHSLSVHCSCRYLAQVGLLEPVKAGAWRKRKGWKDAKPEVLEGRDEMCADASRRYES